MSTMESILATLEQRILETGNWTLSLNELETLVDPVTLYRAVYELKLVGRDLYSLRSAGELVGLLEHSVASDAELQMRNAGLFLSHDDRIGLTERFVRHVRRAIVLHVPAPEMFRGMVGHFKRYDIAEQTYCDTYLNLVPISDACSIEHGEDRENSEVHQLTAKWYLGTLVDRRIVVLTDLGPALFDLLRSIGRQEGALPRIEAEGPETASDRGSGQESGRRAGALALLQLRSAHPSRSEIQSRYRSLMRQYHPDVNPDGLEMAKQINAAYAALLTSEYQR